MVHEIVRKITRGIVSTAVLQAMTDEVKILLHIDIERGHSEVRFGYLRFLLHLQDTVVLIEHDDAGALQFLDRRLLMIHDTTGLLGFGEVHELAEGEEEEVICRHHEQVIVQLQFIHREEQVSYCAETRLVGRSAIIDDGDGLGVVLLSRPFVEDMRKTMVGDDDMLVDLRNGINIIKHTA